MQSKTKSTAFSSTDSNGIIANGRLTPNRTRKRAMVYGI